MATASALTKRMTIVPEVTNVNRFVSDMGRVSKSVNRATQDINKSLRGITSASVNLNRTANSVRGFGSAITGSLSGLSRWASSFDASNNALTKFGRTLTSVGGGLSRFSFQLERFSRGLIIGLTLPFVAASIAAINAGKNFEKALVKVETLVGVNTETVEAWGKEIMEVAANLGALPTEMADGLFAAASGFGSLAAQSPVMDVLVASTKAATIGLGETEDIARAATAMMNAFGKEALTAEEAVSLLVLGVREGNLEVDALATAIGNVLGTTQALGGSAADALAFVSAYTRFGVAPSRAVTALNTALTNLIKPTKTASEVLARYGLTTDTIKEKIAGPQGLAGLLVSMRRGMSEADFLSVFTQRSLRGVLAVTDSISGFADEYLRISDVMMDETDNSFRRMADSAKKGSIAAKRYMKEAFEEGPKRISALEKAFIRYAETVEYKFDQIKSHIQSIFIGADAAMVPMLENILGKVDEALISIEKFIRENQEATTLIIKFGAALALLGPGLLIIAKLGQGFGLFLTAIGALVTALGKAVGLIINFVFHAIRLSVVVGVKLVSSFWMVGSAIYSATVAMIGFIIKTLALTTVALSSWLLGVSRSFIGLAVSIGSSAIASLIPIVTSLIGGVIALATGITGVVAAFAILGTMALATIGALTSLWDTLVGIGERIAGVFTNLSEDAGTWGEGLMLAYGEGIIEGFIYVINSITAIANWITGELSTNSPPKILPDIGKWGKETMQAWIDGWTKADFSVFGDIMDTVERHLKLAFSMMGNEDEEGLIPKILLGSRKAIANAINEIKNLGSVSRAALNRIYNAIGPVTQELRTYIDATLNAAAAAKKMADAQQKINDISERYAEILKPIQKRLKEIEGERSVASDSREIDRLKRLLQREDLPSQIRDLANLRIEEIQLEGDVQQIEETRDRELAIAEQQLQAATDANTFAQEQLDHAKGALDIQERSMSLMEKLIQAQESIKESINSLADGVTGGIDSILGELQDPTAALPSEGGIDLGDLGGEDGILGAYDEKIQDLKDAANEMATAWKTAWDAMTLDVSVWWANIVTKYGLWEDQVADDWGPTLTALELAASETWENLTTVVSDFWTDTVDQRSGISTWFEDLIDQLGDNLPTAIGTFASWVNITLIPTIDKILDHIAGGEEPQFGYETSTGKKWLDGLIESLGIPEGWEADLDKNLEDFKTSHHASWALFKLDISIAANETMIWAQGIADVLGTAGKTIYDAVKGISVIPEVDIEIPEDPDYEIELFDPYGWDSLVGFFDNMITKFKEVREESMSTGERLSGDMEDAGNAAKLATPDMNGFTDSAYGLGVGFFTLGTKTDIARLATEALKEKLLLLKTKILEVKDQAMATLIIKIGELRDIKEEWREKIEGVIEWVGNLITDIEGVLLTALTSLYDYLFKNINPIFTILNELLESAVGWIKDTLDKAIDSLTTALDGLKKKLDPILEPLKSFVDLLERMVKAVSGLSKKLIDWVLGGGNPDDFDGDGGDDEPPGTDKGTSSFPAAPGGGISPDSFGTPSVSDILGAATTSLSVVSTGRKSSPAPSVSTSRDLIDSTASIQVIFGDITINNDMDMAVFEARVRNTISESMSG